MGRNKEQSARMLDHLVVNAPRLIRPYMESILKVLVPKLKEQEPNPGVVVSVLTAVGDLAEVSASSKFSRFLELIKRKTNIMMQGFIDSYIRRCNTNSSCLFCLEG